MYKGKKHRTAVLVKRTAFAMALCVMIGSLGIPVSAEEKSGDLHLLENADSGTSKKNVPEGGNEASSDNDTEVKKPEEGGNKESSGDNTEDKKPEEGGDKESSGDNTEDKKPEEGGDKESSGDNTEDKKPEEGGNEESSGNDTEEKEPGEENGGAANGNESGEQKPEDSLTGSTGEDGKGNAQGIVTGNGEKEIDKKNPEKQVESGEEQKIPEIPEIIDVVVPSAYMLALNPYQLPVRLGEGEETTEQIITGTYGIVNKSSSNQIVTVSFMVEDRTEGKLLFVDSPEEARNAGKDVYAIYLAAIPANEEPVLIDGLPVDSDVSGESLQSVGMTGASEQAVTLYAGANQIAFRLSAAIYDVESEEEPENWVKLSGEKTESEAVHSEKEPESGETLSGEKLEDDAVLPGKKPGSDADLSEEKPGNDAASSEGESESGEAQPEEDAEGDAVSSEENADLSENGSVNQGSVEDNAAEEDEENATKQPDIPSVGGSKEDLEDQSLEAEEDGEMLEVVLRGLDPDGKSVTAYTFYGVMNPDAEWEKLSGGIRLSVVYSYREADGSEEIIEGTGAMIYVN